MFDFIGKFMAFLFDLIGKFGHFLFDFIGKMLWRMARRGRERWGGAKPMKYVLDASLYIFD